MFGKRGSEPRSNPGMGLTSTLPKPSAAPVPAPKPREPVSRAPVAPPPAAAAPRESAVTSDSSAAVRPDSYYARKAEVFAALIDTIDLSQLARLDAESAREEIRDIVNDIVA
ncbi:MAG: CpaF family protein, partial [Aurantimonas coralicida]|nr:CpaF family protein [Aurantimonas coralicida]